MKRTLIGGFFTMLGSFWCMFILLYIQDRMVTSWHTPPGRVITTLGETHMGIPFLLAAALAAVGLAILIREYFRKES
ncbi:hypothetical protein [Oscillibacter sp. 1-3]|uniref:hypothetical protein n=1 Tax=Oscillibacter sp. 1-3 TaxID=1235797 RepID=UPI00033B2A1C|nr:hypothetical protein [Oscillibacter sp. 1-3]EOS67573.1 hypothetical protein C816_00087 [Oscillibacter sp. 1-3]